MRCYHLCNFYLGGIQAGIQSAHAQTELALKYLTGDSPEVDSPQASAEYGYSEWATNHKTMILLNGGMAKDLLEIKQFLTDDANRYAWATFHEEEAAINGAITNVCIVLPEKMYTKSRDIIRAAGTTNPKFRTVDIPGAVHSEVVNLDSQPDDAILSVIMYDEEGHATSWRYTQFEFALLKALSRCDLMR